MRRLVAALLPERILNEELDKLGWTGAELARRAKGDARKIQVAQRLRAETAVTLKRIAAELHMGTGTHVANRLKKRMARMPQTNNPNSDLCKYSGLTRMALS